MEEPQARRALLSDDEGSALLTDMYQVSMAHAYWAEGRAHAPATFEASFRRAPFGGTYAVMAGAWPVAEYLRGWGFTGDDIAVLRSVRPEYEDDFWEWLSQRSAAELEVTAVPDGRVIFPHEPIVQVTGPLAVAQLVETAILHHVGRSTLVATKAARLCQAAPDSVMMEFGLRRGSRAILDTRAAMIGGFTRTSNVAAAGRLAGPECVVGTMAHSFILSHTGERLAPDCWLPAPGGRRVSVFVPTGGRQREDELCAFMAYARSAPDGAVFLIDTYDVLESGLPNAIQVMNRLRALRWRVGGVRLDSGDLKYLAAECRARLDAAGLGAARIVATNDIDENVLWSMEAGEADGSCVDMYGVGTHLVSPGAPLGVIYKLVEVGGLAVAKRTEDRGKATIPWRKDVTRVTGKDGRYIIDVMCSHGEAPCAEQLSGSGLIVFDPFNEERRATVRAAEAEALLEPLPAADSIEGARARLQRDMGAMRADHLRAENPTPYKVGVTARILDAVMRTRSAMRPRLLE